MFLLNGVEEDTNGTAINTDGSGKTLAIWSTDFGSGTVTIQGSPDGGTTWITLTISGTDATFTANAIRYIDRLVDGMKIRATLTGSTTPDPVYVKIF